MGITLPVFSKDSIRYVPWHANDDHILNLHHDSLKTSPPVHINQTVVDELDEQYQLYDKRLTKEINTANDKIDKIKEQNLTTFTLMLLYVTAGLTLLNTILVILLLCYCCRSTSIDQPCQ
jgi:hypothetical protein